MNLFKQNQENHKLLGQLDANLDKGVAHAHLKKFEPSVLLHSRIAPDMFPLLRQVQFTCDQAKFIASRASGKDAPKHDDKETTVDELKARIAEVRGYIAGFHEHDFKDASTIQISLPRWEGKSLSAMDYVVEHALPNFFFHLTTAYLILRHNGVDVGKRDFLGQLNFK